MKTTLRIFAALIVLGGTSSSFAQTRTKGVQYELRSTNPCDPNTSCMWIDLTNKQVQFFDGTTAKTMPSIVTSSKGDMAIFDGTKWQKLSSSGVNGQVLTVDTTAATGWKVAAAAGGGTLASTYNNGAAPADETMSINNTKGPVKILDSLAGGPMFRATFSDDVFDFINVDSSNTHGVRFLFDGVNSDLALGADALFHVNLHFTSDNTFDIGTALVAAAHVFTRIVSSGANTLALIGNGDQVNLSSTGLDPNVDIVTTLGTILKRYLSFAVKSGTVYYNNMGATSTFGEGLLLRGSALTSSYPGSGQVEYSPLVEFAQSYGQTSDPESGFLAARMALQGRMATNASSLPVDNRIAILSDSGTGTYSEVASVRNSGAIVCPSVGASSSTLHPLPAGTGSVAVIDVAQTFTASQNVLSVPLADGPTIATNAALGNVFTVTLGGNRTLGNPTNLVAGGTYSWVITQGGGSNTLAYDTAFKWPGGLAPTLSTAAGAVDMISCIYTGSTLKCVSQLDFQ